MYCKMVEFFPHNVFTNLDYPNKIFKFDFCLKPHIDGLGQGCGNSNALAVELPQPCTESLILHDWLTKNLPKIALFNSIIHKGIFVILQFTEAQASWLWQKSIRKHHHMRNLTNRFTESIKAQQFAASTLNWYHFQYVLFIDHEAVNISRSGQTKEELKSWLKLCHLTHWGLKTMASWNFY